MGEVKELFNLVDVGIFIQSLGWILLVLVTVIQKIAPEGKKPWSILFSFIGKEINKEMLDNQSLFAKKLEELDEKLVRANDSIEEVKATAAKVRIQRFVDDLTEGKNVEKDRFIQVFEDIKCYSDYCKEHRKFDTPMMESVTRFIMEQYDKKLRSNDFLH